VTTIDWIIVAFTLLMAVWGYLQGLVVGALSLAGFVAGAFLGSRVAPLLLSGGAQSPYTPLVTLVAAVTLGGVLATVLETLGFGLRRKMGPTLGTIDGAAGAALVACFGLGLVWVAGAVALQPPANVPAPNSRIARDAQVRAAGRSVVRVLGTACGLGVQGSGWVAGRGIVVTNAHVVAGEDDTTVQLQGGGAHLQARAVWFDPHDDIAVLRVSGLGGAPPLRLNEGAGSGTSGAVLGFPHDGPYDVEPARLGSTTEVLTQDAYGRGPVRRSITSFRGLVRSGNSGGPVVDGDGRVLATVFAASVGSGRHTGFGVPDSVVRDALGKASAPVSTGPCAR
jgi:hypothetical protein